MFLAAKLLSEHPDHESALSLLEQLGNTQVQALDEVGLDGGIIFLDAVVNCEQYTITTHFILLTTEQGVSLFCTSGKYLSATIEGARLSFVADHLDEAMEECSKPIVCRVFELSCRGVFHALH